MKSSLIDVQNHVKPGRYVVGLVQVQPGGGDRKVNGVFRIAEGEHEGVLLGRYYSLPMRGLRPSQSSKLSKDFFALFGERPPVGLRPEMFLADVRIEVVVCDVELDRDRTKKASALVYSKVNSMVRIVAGTPRMLQR